MRAMCEIIEISFLDGGHAVSGRSPARRFVYVGFVGHLALIEFTIIRAT